MTALRTPMMVYFQFWQPFHMKYGEGEYWKGFKERKKVTKHKIRRKNKRELCKARKKETKQERRR